jgi:hypothetical protein
MAKELHHGEGVQGPTMTLKYPYSIYGNDQKLIARGFKAEELQQKFIPLQFLGTLSYTRSTTLGPYKLFSLLPHFKSWQDGRP